MSAFARFNCAICLDWLDDTKATVVTDCGHLFHKQCIEGSLRRTLGCPSCRDRVKELKSVFFSTAPFNQTDLQEELDMAYKTINSLSRERTDLNVTQADIDAMAKTISDLSVENRRLRSNVDSLQKQLSETRSSYSGLMQRVDTLMKGARNLEKAYRSQSPMKKLVMHQCSASASNARLKELKTTNDKWLSNRRSQLSMSQPCEFNCPICLYELEGPRTVLETPCGHLYHEECITRWLQGSSNCPYCRAELARDPERLPTLPPIFLHPNHRLERFSETYDSEVYLMVFENSQQIQISLISLYTALFIDS
ncbi:hypothetical protein QR680_015243 [Steinernema hermaphroditum]|uniref:RING-type domain-containing protein n=1 Tax=Steinernema hermaphroditum TaxID=289476 RepID=A0AA39H8Y3_9BILA|nr:hypothetical protein QR680_015243 [Steinernema hermaphroditum]